MNIHDFVRLLRSHSTHLPAHALSENVFAQRWIFGVGLLYLRGAVDVETTTRTTHLILQQVGYRGGIISEDYTYEDKIHFMVLESDKTQTEFVKNVERRMVTHPLPFQAKIVKKGPGGKRKRFSETNGVGGDEVIRQNNVGEGKKDENGYDDHTSALSMTRMTASPIRF